MAKSHQTKRAWPNKRRSLVRRLLQTRQIYVRSNGDVQFITVSPISQVCLLVIALIGLFWTAYASINIVFKAQLLDLKQQKLFEARLDYENRLSELRASAERVNDRLLLDQKSYLKKVDEVKAEFDNLAGQQKKMEEFFREGWFPLKPDAVQREAPQVEGHAESDFMLRYAAEFRSRAEVTAPLAEMNDKFRALHDRQLSLLKQAHEFSQHKLEKTNFLMTKLGIRPPGSNVLTRADINGVGGPFIGLAEFAQREAEIVDGMEDVHNTLAQESKVRAAVGDLPLAMPVAHSTGISSPYGYRKDPLRLSLAFHGGIDFKGLYGEPVLATSAGVVNWAGPHGPYGNMVEILHDNGVSTRYGHMKSVNVSPGQKIKRGDVVGWLGNTGRSTGPHLHYETRVEGRVMDPQNFWRLQNDLQALEKLN